MKGFGRMALWSALGGLAGAALYLVYVLVAYRHPGWRMLVSPDLVLWLLWMGIPTLPVAFGAVLLARFAARWGTPAMLAASLLGAAASAPLFIWYMRHWSPLIAWERGWILPLAAAVAALIVNWIDWSGRKRTTAEL